MFHTLRITLASIFICVGLFSSAQSAHYKFTENKGQYPDQVLFSAVLENGIIFFEKDKFTYNVLNSEDLGRIGSYHGKITENPDYSIRGHAYEVMFENSSTANIQGKDLQRGITSYFIGSDESKWGKGCRSFSEIIYESVYPGINLRVFANDFLLKFEYIVSAGADPSIISQVYKQTDNLKLEKGKLVISTYAGIIKEQNPISYQTIENDNHWVESNYIKKKNRITYDFPSGYDSTRELVIDPELIFSTYSGSVSNNFGYTATFDNDGFLYSGSSAFGNDYPTTLGSYDTTFGGGTVDIALSKVDTSGSFFVWSAYLGGDNEDLPHSIMVNNEDELYVLGTSGSADFPTTAGSFDQFYNLGTPESFLNGLGVNYDNGSDIVLAKISADGSELLSSTYLGGSENDGLNYGSALKYNYADEIRGEIQLNDEGEVYVVSSTYSSDFPVSDDALQSTNNGESDAIAFKMDADLTQLLWSTYVGGSDNDAGYSLTFDSEGDVIICGGTISNDFPVSGNALQNTFGGGSADGFYTKITDEGEQMPYSTFYGSEAYDQLYFVETDETDNLYVFGQTEHNGSQFIQNAAYNQIGGGQIISKFSVDLESVDWSTAFGTGGGEPNISPTAFLVDVCDRIYLSGWGGATGGSDLSVTGMDVTDDAFKSETSSGDFYLMVLFDDASDIFYASFFGGDQSNEHVDGGTSRFNRKGQIYQAVCAGCGSNDDFPNTPGNSISAMNNASCNLGVFKFDFQLPLTVADFNVPDQICTNQEFSVNNQSIFSDTYEWNFGDGSPLVSGPNPTHTYDEPGTYLITLNVTSITTCNAMDELFKEVTIEDNSVSASANVLICDGDSVQIGPEENANHIYQWTPNDFLSSASVSSPVASPETDIDYILSITRGACVDTVFQTVSLENIAFGIPDDMVICNADIVDLSLTTDDDLEVIWSSQPDFSAMENDNLADYDISVAVTENTTYFVQANGEVCEETNEVSISVFSESVQLQNDLNICAGDTVTISVLNPLEGINYSWSPESAVLSGNGTPEIAITALEPIQISVNASLGECEAEDDINIGVINSSGTQFEAYADPLTIIEGGESQLSTSISGLNYSWSPTGSLNNHLLENPVASPSETTTYTVTGGEGDCLHTAKVTVRVVDFICGEPLVFLPNAFSPNKDGENDQLFVFGQNLTEVHLAVFNRWGQKVFETFDQEIGWDGYYNGKLSDPAVFDYYLEVTCEGGVDYFEKGNVTLVR